MIIYLDFDGVLHPDAVYRPTNKPLELRAPGELFMHANVLIDALDPYPQAKIILSTSWVRMLGYERTLKKMPPELAARVTGATWHKSMKDGNQDFFHSVYSRYEQVLTHVNRHNVQRWIAIDDLHSGSEVDNWKAEHWDHLVLTKQEVGLGCKKTQHELKIKLDVLGKYGI
jgi:hypothetical protein